MGYLLKDTPSAAILTAIRGAMAGLRTLSATADAALSERQDYADLTQRELANKIGMSVGGLNYCLNALIDKGLVKMQNFSSSKNKFKYVYLLTPQGIAERVALTSRFLDRKMQEYEALKAEIESLHKDVQQAGKPDPLKAS